MSERKPRRITLLVCGGRDYDHADAWNWLERNAKDSIAERLNEAAFELAAIVHGGAHGADEGAGDWGKSEGIPVCVFKADWRKHGNAAGPIRNQRMLDDARPDIVIALPGGRGTADMVRRAHAAGVPVVEVG